MNIPYRLSNYRGHWNRARFAARANRLRTINVSADIPCDVYSFSGERDWLEQLASTRTFLASVGRPRKFVIVSDGTHTSESKRILESVSSCVSVQSVDQIAKKNPHAASVRYAARHPLGKKLLLLSSLPVDIPTIYTDSDIVFFSASRDLTKWITGKQSYFLEDCAASLDKRLILPSDTGGPNVNSGFLILKEPIRSEPFMERLMQVADTPIHFTEQTIIQLSLHGSGAIPLPTEQFVLRYDDQFDLFDRYGGKSIALRHYISSIRTKMWHHLSLFS